MPARSLKICTGLRAALVFTDVGEMANKKKKKKLARIVGEARKKQITLVSAVPFGFILQAA